MTSRQLQVLRYVHRVTRAQGYPPALREVCAHLGTGSVNGARDHLRALMNQGLLTGKPRTSRSFVLTSAGLKALEAK